MVDLSSLKEYVESYSERQKMLEIAFRFSKLGERMLDIPPSHHGLYIETSGFIYSTISEGFDNGQIKEAILKFGDDIIPIENTPECDEYVPEISCALELFDINSKLLCANYTMFPHPYELEIDHYINFARDSLEKTVRTICMGLAIDSFTLSRFVKYALLMGGGMPVKNAVMERRSEIQIEYFKLQ